MTICANKKCGQEVTRARFVEGIGWLCLDCAPHLSLPNVSGAMFPYTTFAIADGPGNVEVKSLRHLRQLERKYGVQSVAFNQDSKNWDPPQQRRLVDHGEKR